MQAKIIIYNQEKLKPKEKTKLKRVLYGHKDTSHKGKYTYKRSGIVEKIPHIKPARAVIIIRKKDVQIITQSLERFKTTFRVYDIIVRKNELK